MVVVHCNFFGNGIASISATIHHYYTGLPEFLFPNNSNIRHPKSKIKTKNLMLFSRKPLSAMERDLGYLLEQHREDVNGIL
ncbi:MAG: hypothetical protein F6K24_57535 [Okeania sp. SIO2D1]|nr:hypothetical protein [Okeania sp. SIO2D1]